MKLRFVCFLILGLVSLFPLRSGAEETLRVLATCASADDVPPGADPVTMKKFMEYLSARLKTNVVSLGEVSLPASIDVGASEQLRTVQKLELLEIPIKAIQDLMKSDQASAIANSKLSEEKRSGKISYAKNLLELATSFQDDWNGACDLLVSTNFEYLEPEQIHHKQK